MGHFIHGSAVFLTQVGFSHELAVSLVAVVAVSFALTTLDSATRLLRYNVSELGDNLGLSFLSNRYLATALACAAILFFAFYKIDGKPAGLALWQLFGMTNQLLAGLALLVITLYLSQRKRAWYFTGVTMIWMLSLTLLAMVKKMNGFYHKDQWLLFSVAVILFVLAICIGMEGILSFFKVKTYETLDVVFQ